MIEEGRKDADRKEAGRKEGRKEGRKGGSSLEGGKKSGRMEAERKEAGREERKRKRCILLASAGDSCLCQ